MNFILELSLHGSLVFLLVWVLDRVLACRMRTMGRGWWWMAIPLTFLISVPLSILPPVVAAPIAHEGGTWGPIVHAGAAMQVAAGKIGLSRSEIWLWFWLAGATVYALVIIIQTRTALVRWSRERLSTDSELLALLEDCKREAGITAPIGLVISDHVFAPAILGWLRPRILLPGNLLSSMPRHQLRAVLFHELAHFRSFDIPFNWLFTLARAVHWFNPLAHVAFNAWANFREEAADEIAMTWMKASSGISYGEALLCAIREANAGAPPFGALAIGESIHNLKRRINMINQYQNKSSRLLLAGAVLILVITGFIVRPIHADTGAPKPVLIGGTLNQLMQAMQNNAGKAASNQTGLQILRAFCGADNSWQDVTDILQNSVKDNGLRISWQQPYRELGGDPAAGRIKMMVISYQIDGKTKIAVFQEENPPVGLRLIIP